MMPDWRSAVIASVILTAVIALNGCVIDVDLTSEPKVVAPGEPVRFDLQVTNRATCPVGGVVSLLFPFVPRNYFIDQIANPALRQTLSNAADVFCTSRSYEFPDGDARCRIEEGELICEIDGNKILPPGYYAQAPVALSGTWGDNEVTCETTETSVLCRIPESLYADALRTATAESEESLGSLHCVETSGGIVICVAALLDPAETKSDHISVAPADAGAYRNWVLSFSTVAGGVCSGPGLLRNLPCDAGSPCPGIRTCRPGICAGGANAGYGCTTGGDCPDGSCSQCELPDEGEVQAGLSCTTAVATLPLGAPAMSWWAMFAGIGLLFGAGGLSLHRARRSR
jgi:hypothetical protein